MTSKKYNPNDIGKPNGNFFGFPYSLEESNIVLYPVCWDVTTSYKDGTSLGPEAIIEASVQLDFFDPLAPEAWTYKHGTVPIDQDQIKTNKELRAKAKHVIEALENGTSPKSAELKKLYKDINAGTKQMVDKVLFDTEEYIEQGKIVGLIGGDHSTSLGLMKAIDKQYDSWGILQIDAHADLRVAYEGFKHSHASIMFNALQETTVDSITQVGIRDLSPDEHNLIVEDYRITTFFDTVMQNQRFQGRTWESICQEIIMNLPQNIYVSFDIDGLQPQLCPNTGTPVPGGLTLEEAIFLLHKIVLSGREIVGFDVVEVAPSKDSSNDWDANVGARLIYRLSNLAWLSKVFNGFAEGGMLDDDFLNGLDID